MLAPKPCAGSNPSVLYLCYSGLVASSQVVAVERVGGTFCDYIRVWPFELIVMGGY